MFILNKEDSEYAPHSDEITGILDSEELIDAKEERGKFIYYINRNENVKNW